MTVGEKLRSYSVEPVLATLLLLLALQVFPKPSIAAMEHAEARDLLAISAVMLGASFALWIGLFWVSSTKFGEWMARKNELTDVGDTYIYAIAVWLVATLSTVMAAFLSADFTKTQLVCLWFFGVALLSVPGMLNNTRNLIKLHSAFAILQSQTKPDVVPLQRANGR